MFAATAIVIADMVGVGVFTSLGFQVKTIDPASPVVALGRRRHRRVVRGACYAELAAMFPRSSGEYNFLLAHLSSGFGFLAGWLSATVGFAAPVALAAMAFGEYFKPLFPAYRRWCSALASPGW